MIRHVWYIFDLIDERFIQKNMFNDVAFMTNTFPIDQYFV